FKHFEWPGVVGDAPRGWHTVQGRNAWLASLANYAMVVPSFILHENRDSRGVRLAQQASGHLSMQRCRRSDGLSGFHVGETGQRESVNPAETTRFDKLTLSQNRKSTPTMTRTSACPLVTRPPEIQ